MVFGFHDTYLMGNRRCRILRQGQSQDLCREVENLQVHRGMGAAREFLRLSQQNLAAMDEPEAAAAAPQAADMQAPAQPGPAGLDFHSRQPQLTPQSTEDRAASMLPNNSFLALLHGKSHGPAARQAERAQQQPAAQRMPPQLACSLTHPLSLGILIQLPSSPTRASMELRGIPYIYLMAVCICQSS